MIFSFDRGLISVRDSYLQIYCITQILVKSKLQQKVGRISQL